MAPGEAPLALFLLPSVIHTFECRAVGLGAVGPHVRERHIHTLSVNAEGRFKLNPTINPSVPFRERPVGNPKGFFPLLNVL